MPSTHTGNDGQTVSLADYLGRMKPEQDKIYYLTADSYTAALASPHLEVFRKKGVEVLLLTDRVDEWVTSHLTEFDGKNLVSVARGALDLGAGRRKRKSQPEGQRRSDETAGGRAERHAERHRQGSACHPPPDRIARLPGGGRIRHEQPLAAHAQGSWPGRAGEQADSGNQPGTPAGEKLDASRSQDTRFADLAHIVFDQALLAEGGQLSDPAGFVKRINALMLELSA